MKLAIGYAFSPGAFVSDTRKSAGMFRAAPAAAAVVLSMVGSMNWPARFRTTPTGSWFLIAYASST